MPVPILGIAHFVAPSLPAATRAPRRRARTSKWARTGRDQLLHSELDAIGAPHSFSTFSGGHVLRPDRVELALIWLNDQFQDPAGLEDSGVGPMLSGIVVAPNPTRRTATLSFELSQAEHVSLAIYDLTGRSLAQIAQGVLGSGHHSFVWEADDLPQGTTSIASRERTRRRWASSNCSARPYRATGLESVKSRAISRWTAEYRIRTEETGHEREYHVGGDR